MAFGDINIAWIYYRQHNYPKALEYFNQCANLRLELNDRHGRTLALSEFINKLDKSSRKTYKLLENLLCWSMAQTGRHVFSPCTINLSEIAKETIRLLDSQAGNKNISLSLSSEDTTEAFADEEMIKTVLRNLISNSIKTEKFWNYNRWEYV